MPKNDKQQIWDSYYFLVDGGKEENAIGEDSWTLFVSLYFSWITVQVCWLYSLYLLVHLKHFIIKKEKRCNDKNIS